MFKKLYSLNNYLVLNNHANEAEQLRFIINKYATAWSGGVIKDKASGDKFRLWVNQNHPEVAERLDLDPSGSFNNVYIQRAWSELGREYMQQLYVAPKFRDFEKDIGLDPRDKTSERSAGERAIANGLYALSKAAKPLAVASAAAPLPVTFLMNFLALREELYDITGPDLRRAMHYVCMSAEGGQEIGYANYQLGQKYDPERKTITASTYGYGSAAEVVTSYDPYAQLSAAIGQGYIVGTPKEGFIVKDAYNFNLDRDKTVVESASNYIANIPNIEALIGRILNRQVGGGVIGGVEEVLVMYEHTLRYAGFPVTIRTIPEGAELGMADRFRDLWS